MFLGEAARGINPNPGRGVSAEGAKSLQRRSEKAGLISSVGKNRLDKVWHGVWAIERLLAIDLHLRDSDYFQKCLELISRAYENVDYAQRSNI